MLKINKDHQSAGLWWSLLLSGDSLGGHGSFLGLISSCFVFPIISPITAGVAVDVLWKCLPHLMVHGKNQFLLCNNMSWRPVFFNGKAPLHCLEHRTQKRGEKSITWDAFGSCFWTVLAGPSHLSRCMFGLNGLACVWGLSDGPIPWPFVSAAVDYWVLFVLGPQSKVWYHFNNLRKMLATFVSIHQKD